MPTRGGREGTRNHSQGQQRPTKESKRRIMLRTARARKKYLRGKKHELHPSHGKGARELSPPRREEPYGEKDREERKGNNKGKGKEAPKKDKTGPPPQHPTPPPEWARGAGRQEGKANPKENTREKVEWKGRAEQQGKYERSRKTKHA
jgi:glyoxylase-like metal-dependent hydrolase (beta-lactamase superfamily II)